MIQRYRAHLPYLVRYLLIGGFVFIIDFGTYAKLLNVVSLGVAQTVSQTIAFITHFILNKYLNFRSFDRSTREQFATYLVVAVFCLIVGVGVVYVWVWLFGPTTTSKYLAKCAAVGVNIPIGFVGHKKLTFGGGLRSLTRAKASRAA